MQQLASRVDQKYTVHFGRFISVLLNAKNWIETKKTLKQYWSWHVFPCPSWWCFNFKLFEHLHFVVVMKKILLNTWWTLKKVGLLLCIINNYKVHHILQFKKKTLISNVITLESLTCSKFVDFFSNFLISNLSITYFFMDYDLGVVYITKSIFHWILMLLV